MPNSGNLPYLLPELELLLISIPAPELARYYFYISIASFWEQEQEWALGAVPVPVPGKKVPEICYAPGLVTARTNVVPY